MKTLRLAFLPVLFSVCRLVETAQAADEAPADQFLGSPLLVLAAVLLIALVAQLYHRIRK